MVLDVLLDHLLGDIACAPGCVAYGPEVIAPVLLLEMGKFILDEEFTAAFLHVSRENVIAVLCDPDDVHGEAGDRMTAMPVGIGHSRAF